MQNFIKIGPAVPEILSLKVDISSRFTTTSIERVRVRVRARVRVMIEQG